MISRVPNARCDRHSERITSSVTTPPALRMMWASPRARPRIPKIGMRESMQATIAARPCWRDGQTLKVESLCVLRVVGQQFVCGRLKVVTHGRIVDAQRFSCGASLSGKLGP